MTNYCSVEPIIPDNRSARSGDWKAMDYLNRWMRSINWMKPTSFHHGSTGHRARLAQIHRPGWKQNHRKVFPSMIPGIMWLSAILIRATVLVQIWMSAEWIWCEFIFRESVARLLSRALPILGLYQQPYANVYPQLLNFTGRQMIVKCAVTTFSGLSGCRVGPCQHRFRIPHLTCLAGELPGRQRTCNTTNQLFIECGLASGFKKHHHRLYLACRDYQKVRVWGRNDWSEDRTDGSWSDWPESMA